MDDCLVSREEQHCQDDDRTNPKPRACSNCARLKMKCQWPATGSARPEKTCSRCARMKLSCHVPEAAPRKKRGKSTRVAQLEKKLDGIVSLLASSQHIQAKGPSPLTPESPKATQAQPPPASKPVNQFTHVEENASYRICGGNLHDKGDDAPSDPAYLELFPGFRLTHDEASQHLDVYRRDLVPAYPFVPLIDGLSSRELYAQSPFLFWTVMSVVVSLPSTVQSEIKTWFRTYLAEHVIVLQERRLDILQAILIHLAW
ncbi:hypothetical protein QQZ08_009815 [Neonectria magnoliae]|uniref:Zn(2)-C6 fungal-type domain-containing protein n=1 Tax=Neonectria magnoliae TaxID=2732573 RepID=A0ABR1HLM5_9HYPO